MLIDGIAVSVGQTIAFDYNGHTRSGIRSRIGEVESINPALGVVTIREHVNGQNQYRSFRKAAMRNVLVD